MGIKQTITKEELPVQYQKYSLIETQDGMTHSVYLLDDQYVVKIVENDELEALQNEQELLKKLKDLKTPQLLDIVKKEEYILAFYTQIEGVSYANPTLSHVEQIALFLKKFHTISKNRTSSNPKIYDNEYLKQLIIETKNSTLLNHFDNIDCQLKNDGIIHGDLFYDNAKFQKNTLSGVYDFIEACEGDFVFELAVVAISWCFENEILNKEKTVMLLDTYRLDIKYFDFKEYVKYALLYYVTTRYLDNRNYQELIKKLENV